MSNFQKSAYETKNVEKLPTFLLILLRIPLTDPTINSACFSESPLNKEKGEIILHIYIQLDLPFPRPRKHQKEAENVCDLGRKNFSYLFYGKCAPKVHVIKKSDDHTSLSKTDCSKLSKKRTHAQAKKSVERSHFKIKNHTKPVQPCNGCMWSASAP